MCLLFFWRLSNHTACGSDWGPVGCKEQKTDPHGLKKLRAAVTTVQRRVGRGGPGSWVSVSFSASDMTEAAAGTASTHNKVHR